MPNPMRRNRRPSEDGYMMIAVMFLVAALTIALAVALPKVKESIQRDREVETMQRGKQYIRAVQLYYRKFHAYPPNVDALVKTQEIRFLRKKYVDPMTGKDDWKPIQFGQNKAPTAMGFFGQAMSGSSIAGIGPGGGNGLNPGGNGLGTGAGLTPTPTTPPTGGTNSTDGSQQGTDPNATGAAGSGQTTGVGVPQTFGGAGIIGFSPDSAKTSILVYKKKNHYNEWEFVYDPQMDLMTGNVGGAGSGATPINGTGNTGGLFGNNPNLPGGNNPNQPGGNNPNQPGSNNPNQPTNPNPQQPQSPQ